MEVVTHLGFCVSLQNVTQAEMSKLVHNHGRFADSVTITFLVA
jgi:hypothetical protein